MTETRPMCVIGDNQHQAHHGLLCERHLQRLATLLRDVEDEAIHLELVPSLAVGYDSAAGGTLASHKAPARIDVICLTDRRRGEIRWSADEFDELALDDTPSVLETLGTWARMVRNERALSDPEGPATVSGERDLLTRQLTWIAGQPWVDEFYDDLAFLARALKRANNTLELPVGVCGTFYGAQQCDGQVWHIVIKHDGGPDEPGFRCAACRRVWTGTEAVRKRDDLWRDEQARKAAKV